MQKSGLQKTLQIVTVGLVTNIFGVAIMCQPVLGFWDKSVNKVGKKTLALWSCVCVGGVCG